MNHESPAFASAARGRRRHGLRRGADTNRAISRQMNQPRCQRAVDKGQGGTQGATLATLGRGEKKISRPPLTEERTDE